MVLTPDKAAKIATLISTPDDLLPLFPIMERCIIIALKEKARNERKVAGDMPIAAYSKQVQEGAQRP